VPRTLDHDLHALVAGAQDELAQGPQLGELRGVGRVRQAAGPEAVAERVGDIVLTHDGADLIEELVHRILLAVDDHPFGEQGSASRDDARDAGADQREMLAQHTGVDGEVIDALLRPGARSRAG